MWFRGTLSSLSELEQIEILAKERHLCRDHPLEWAEFMLVGYVSDERYVALPDVLFEFARRSAR